MKKSIALIGIYLAFLITSCICPNKGGSLTEITIHSAKGILFSFDKNGIFPYFDSINRNELGIGIVADSISEQVLFTENFISGNQLYACENINKIEYLNSIDSIDIFTIYKFDDNHDEQSKVNDILKPIDQMGEIVDIENINDLIFVDQFLKFTHPPKYDTLQFEITGRILGGGTFRILTNMLVIEK